MTKVREGKRHDIRSDTNTVIVGTLGYLAACNCDEDTIGPEIEVPNNLVDSEGKYVGSAR